MPTPGDHLTGVYLITNTVNGKVYVGSTSGSFKVRWGTHRETLRNGRHHNQHLQRAYQVYGAAAFTYTVLERCRPDDCLIREQYWIDHFGAADPERGYNLSPSAGSNRGTKYSEETCERFSERQKRLHSEVPGYTENVVAALNKARNHQRLRRMTAAHGVNLRAAVRCKLKVPLRGKPSDG